MHKSACCFVAKEEESSMDSVLISGGTSGGSGGVGVVSVCGSGECHVYNVSSLLTYCIATLRAPK